LHVDGGCRCASDKTFRAPEDPRVGAQEHAPGFFQLFLSLKINLRTKQNVSVEKP
jgi:hypothetical protein